MKSSYFVITIDLVEKEDYEKVKELISKYEIKSERVKYFKKDDCLEVFLCNVTWSKAIELTDIILHMTDYETRLNVL